MNGTIDPNDLPELFVTPRDMRPGDFILSAENWCRVQNVYESVTLPDNDLLVMVIDQWGIVHPCWRSRDGEFQVLRPKEVI